MVNKISVFSCASILAVSLMASAYAEITGSGFRNTDCSGLIHVNLWMDYNGNGFKDRNEPAFSKADIFVSATDAPHKGFDKFTTSDDGSAQIDLLCRGSFTLEIDPDTIPQTATFDAVFEYGVVVVDADVTTEISIDLTGGIGSMAPGVRHLDIAYSPLTRGLR
ncbi:MAG: hypothetical protein AB8G18_17585 [Gammaproteobacteria bacterium]